MDLLAGRQQDGRAIDAGGDQFEDAVEPQEERLAEPLDVGQLAARTPPVLVDDQVRTGAFTEQQLPGSK